MKKIDVIHQCNIDKFSIYVYEDCYGTQWMANSKWGYRSEKYPECSDDGSITGWSMAIDYLSSPTKVNYFSRKAFYLHMKTLGYEFELWPGVLVADNIINKLYKAGYINRYSDGYAVLKPIKHGLCSGYLNSVIRMRKKLMIFDWQ